MGVEPGTLDDEYEKNQKQKKQQQQQQCLDDSSHGVSAYCTLPHRNARPSTRGSRSRKSRNQISPIGAEIPTNCTDTKKLLKGLTVKKDNDQQSLPYYIRLNDDLLSGDQRCAFKDDNMAFDGLSKDLSTESIRNACDFYDDELSDDNITEVRKTPHCFQKQLQAATSVRRSLRSAATVDRRHKKRKKTDEHPLCTLSQRERWPRNALPAFNDYAEGNADDFLSPLARVSSPAQRMTQQHDVWRVLGELDAILDGHGGACASLDSSIVSTGGGCGGGGEVEDCLLELDTYLAGIDDSSIGFYDCDNRRELIAVAPTTAPASDNLRRTRTLPKNLRAFYSSATTAKPSSSAAAAAQIAGANGSLRRGYQLRKATSSFGLETNNNDSNVDDTISGSNSSTYVTGINSTTTSPTFTPTTTCVSDTNAWRRNSMRKTSLLVLPDQQGGESEMEAEEASEPQQQSEGNIIMEMSTPAEDYRTEIASPVSLSPTGTDQVVCLANEEPTPTIQATDMAVPELRRCFSQNFISSEQQQNLVRNSVQPLTHADMFQGILVQNAAAASSYQNVEENRPRQFGRRADGHPRIVSIRSEAIGTGNNHCIIISHENRPTSAPAASQSIGYIESEPSSVGSSRNPSPVSLVSSCESSSTAGSTASPIDPLGTITTHSMAESSDSSQQQQLPRTSPLDPDNIQLTPRQGINAQWPHSFSRILALVCCSLGMFNICRFAVLTIHYGGNFLLQFLLLSFIFGIPLFWLQMCLGAKIKAGPVSMWKISPICRGIGISLVLVQCLVALYSTISVAWVLVYLRDSFLSKTQVLYRWQEPFFSYRHAAATNVSGNLTETIADYFNGMVLQRLQLGKRSDASAVRFQVSDRLAFNLAIVWTAVFLVLCKGLKSFGKTVIGLTIVPLLMLLVVTCKFLYVIDFTTLQNIFSASDFEDFLINSKTWTAAAQESFLTWGLLGPSVIAMSSRMHAKDNSKTVLRRDAILVVLVTLLGLSLAALLGFACVQILHNNNYIYIPGSYEQMDTYTSVYSLKSPINAALISFPSKWVPHYSSLVGETYRRHASTPQRESGYQALRLVTELFPAAMALSRDTMHWAWSALAFGMFFLFGVAQLCAMWKPISSALGNSTSSVLLSCVSGLLLGIPLATEVGISIVHYLDMILGGAWFIPILWTAQILGVFLIRGRPYNGDVLVNDLRMTGSMSAFLALSWNVLLPIGMIALAVIEYKVSLSNQFYHWRGKSYFSFWARKLAGLTQVGFLLLVPISAIIQIYRYLTSGPSDILERIQLLYRPSQSALPHRRNRASVNGALRTGGQLNCGTRISNLESRNAHDDAPPKYTPPPSYTTATGARLAKILRQSIRRSVRRILGEPGRSRPILPIDTEMSNSLPPDYSTVLSNPSGTTASASNYMQEDIENAPRPLYNSYTHRTLSLGRNIPLHKQNSTDITTSNNDRSASSVHILGCHDNETFVRQRSSGQPYTAADVATILRASTRQRRQAGASAVTFSLQNQSNCSRSAENLVLNAAPLGNSSAIASSSSPGDDETAENENTSVI